MAHQFIKPILITDHLDVLDKISSAHRPRSDLEYSLRLGLLLKLLEREQTGSDADSGYQYFGDESFLDERVCSLRHRPFVLPGNLCDLWLDKASWAGSSNGRQTNEFQFGNPSVVNSMVGKGKPDTAFVGMEAFHFMCFKERSSSIIKRLFANDFPVWVFGSRTFVDSKSIVGVSFFNKSLLD